MENLLDDIVLVDEDGQEARFSHTLTFLYEGERYVALEPIEQDAQPGDEAEVEIVILHVVSRDGADVYESVENAVLLDEVFEAFLEAMDEIEEENGE